MRRPAAPFSCSKDLWLIAQSAPRCSRFWFGSPTACAVCALGPDGDGGQPHSAQRQRRPCGCQRQPHRYQRGACSFGFFCLPFRPVCAPDLALLAVVVLSSLFRFRRCMSFDIPSLVIRRRPTCRTASIRQWTASPGCTTTGCNATRPRQPTTPRTQVCLPALAWLWCVSGCVCGFVCAVACPLCCRLFGMLAVLPSWFEGCRRGWKGVSLRAVGAAFNSRVLKLRTLRLRSAPLPACGCERPAQIRGLHAKRYGVLPRFGLECPFIVVATGCCCVFRWLVAVLPSSRRASQTDDSSLDLALNCAHRQRRGSAQRALCDRDV